MILSVFSFIIALIILLKGADFLVESAVKIAKYFNISEFLIGITIVSIGTSLPEITANLIASIQGNTGFIVGNVFGSNLANIGLILGLSAIIHPIIVDKKIMKLEHMFFHKDTIILFGVSMLVLFVLSDGIIDIKDSFILLMSFFAYLLYVITEKLPQKKIFQELNIIHFLEIRKLKEPKIPISEQIPKPEYKNRNKFLLKQITLFLFGLVLIAYSADIVVNSATTIATKMNIPLSIIAISIVSIGTTLPELFVSITSVRKKKTGLLIGNIIGSNIVNMLLILGLTSVISPIKIATNLIAFPVIANIIITIILILAVKNKWEITRKEGAIMLCFYIFSIITAFSLGISP